MSRAWTIHVVDDDGPVRDSLAFSLAVDGFAVHGYASATEFLAAAVDPAAACLICDVRMPVLDGVTLTRRLRADGLVFPIYLITGNADAAAVGEALRAGATAVLEKPLDPRAIRAALARIPPPSLQA